MPFGRSLDSLRKPGLERITQQARPLIKAIESFGEEEGRYPKELSELLPDYLQAIPRTGAVGYPNFRYTLAGSNTLFRSYELLVKTPVGGINWDVFVFWPENHYPDYLYGGGVERIADWAYVHE
jgi:hypothetical protein